MPLTRRYKKRIRKTRRLSINKKKSGGNSSNKKKSGSSSWENRFRGFDSSTYKRRKSVKKLSSFKYEEGNTLKNINILHKILYILNSNHVAVLNPLTSRRDFIKNTGIKLIEAYNNIQDIEKICKDLAPYAKYARNVKDVSDIGTLEKNAFKEVIHPLDWNQEENKIYTDIREQLSDEEFNNLIKITLKYAPFSQKELQKKGEEEREIKRKAEQERALAAQIENKRRISLERKNEREVKGLYSSKGIEV